MASASKTRKSDQKTNAATAWSILAALKKPFTDRDNIWPIRRRIRLRQEDPPIPEAYHGTALKHKALALDTPLPTPTGWTTMGEVQVGDWLFDEQGQPTRVLAITPTMEGHKTYDVVFRDGTTIRADAGHYWVVTDHHGQTYKLDTETLAADYLRSNGKTGLIAKYSIENTKPLVLPEASLPVDPYTLGVWLGDGNRNYGHFFTLDEEIVIGVEEAGYFPRESSYQTGAYTTTGLLADLRKADVVRAKHIPAPYFRASIEQRLSLLQGLLDTDGTCALNGEVSFSNTNYDLICGVQELAHSLGIKTTVQVRSDNRKASYLPVYKVSFTTSLPVFRIERKLARLRSQVKRANRRFISEIREVASVPVKCIAVSSASHLFLAGREMVPTSNSAELDWAVRQIVALLSENREQYIIYATDDTQNMQRLADECQKAVSALMEMLEDQHPIERPRSLCHDYQVADGVCAEKYTFDWDFFKRVKDSKGDGETWRDALTNYVKEHKELPIRKVALDPFTLYWEFDINGLVAVAEHSRARRSALIDEYEENKSVMNALARLPVFEASGVEASQGNSTMAAPGTGGNAYSDAGETLTVLEVWTRKEFFLIAENGGGERQTLIRQKHPFKRPPYFFGAGILTGSQNPLHQFQPLVLPLYPLSLELSAVRTARLNAAFLSSFKPFYVKYNAGTAEDEESGNLKIHFLMPGSTIPSLKGGEIVPIQWTNLDELEKMEQSLMADRERFGFQAILSGQSIPSGESTAWATRMMRDQGMVQFNGVLRNYAQMREEEVRFIMDLVRDVLKQDLPVSRRVFNSKTKRGHIQTLYLTKEMVEAGFDVQCRLTAGKASDRISIVEEFRRAKEAGEVSTRMVLEEGWQFENATEIQDEVLDEQIRMQLLPKAMEIIVQMAMAGAEQELLEPQNLSPEEAAMASQEQAMMQEQEAQMAAQQQVEMEAQAAAMQQAQMPLPPGQANPLSGEIPGGVVDAGLQQGLQAPEIPPDEPYGVLLQ